MKSHSMKWFALLVVIAFAFFVGFPFFSHRNATEIPTPSPETLPPETEATPTTPVVIVAPALPPIVDDHRPAIVAPPIPPPIESFETKADRLEHEFDELERSVERWSEDMEKLPLMNEEQSR